MTTKLVIDDFNEVINIIIDTNNEVLTMSGYKLITQVDDSVGIGDTVNDDGSLLNRRAGFYIPTEAERAEEDRKRDEGLVATISDALVNKI